MPEDSPKSVFFIISHASGSAHHYLEGFAPLEELVQLTPLDLSGHGKRRAEKLLFSMPEIIGDLTERAAALLGAPPEARKWLLFGHSMGGLNAFLLAQSLVSRGFREPERLFVSSYSTPGWHPIPPGMTKLPDREMWEASALRFGVLNGQPLPAPEQMELFSPVYRADLIAVENFPQPDPIPVANFPITAVYAEHDMVNAELVAKWRGWTRFPLDMVMVPGGHFHPLERPAQLVELIRGRISG